MGFRRYGGDFQLPGIGNTLYSKLALLLFLVSCIATLLSVHPGYLLLGFTLSFFLGGVATLSRGKSTSELVKGEVFEELVAHAEAEYLAGNTKEAEKLYSRASTHGKLSNRHKAIYDKLSKGIG